MNNIKTRALVEGAIFAAITVIIGIIRFYMPVFSLISMIWSVPTILIAFRHGLKVSMNSVIASSFLVGILTLPIEGIGFFIGFGLPGIIMGYLINRKLGPWKTIFITGLVLAVCSVASIYMGMLAVGVDLAQAYDQMFIDMKSAYSEAINIITKTYGELGVNKEEILRATETFEKSIELLKLILPGGILLSGMLAAFINFKLTRIVLKRINYFIEDVTPFSMWQLSSNSMRFVVGILFATLVELFIINHPQLYAPAMNVIMCVMTLFTVLGLAVAKFFLDKYNVQKVFKGVLLVLLMLMFNNIIMLIGIADVTFDIRRLRSKPAEES